MFKAVLLFARSLGLKTLVASLLFTFTVPAQVSLKPGQEIVFENASNYLGRYANVSREYGDEIELVGVARTVTDFLFEYYGNFVQHGDEAAKIRFYRNDLVLDEFQVAPGTLIYESGFFPINPGHNSRHLTGLNVVVPDNFTWTIQFRGLTMVEGDEAGLVFYHPITKGNSYDDFWARESNGQFALYGYPDVKNNFAAMVIAVPEPGTIAMIGMGMLLLGGAAWRKRRS